MTATTVEVLHPRGVTMPRGARIAAYLFARAAGWLLRAPVQPAIESSRRAREAANVRELARRVQHTDPSFAADLYAAAARHESLDD